MMAAKGIASYRPVGRFEGFESQSQPRVLSLLEVSAEDNLYRVALQDRINILLS